MLAGPNKIYIESEVKSLIFYTTQVTALRLKRTGREREREIKKKKLHIGLRPPYKLK